MLSYSRPDIRPENVSRAAGIDDTIAIAEKPRSAVADADGATLAGSPGGETFHDDTGGDGADVAGQSTDADGTARARPATVNAPAAATALVMRAAGAAPDSAVVTRPAAPGCTAPSGRTVATRRIIGLTAELAAELSRFEASELNAADVHGLMHGLNCTAAALTRLLDRMRECRTLARAGNDLGLPRHHTVRSELEQAAAAAEDLQVSTEALCRLLPTEVRKSPHSQ